MTFPAGRDAIWEYPPAEALASPAPEEADGADAMDMDAPDAERRVDPRTVQDALRLNQWKFLLWQGLGSAAYKELMLTEKGVSLLLW